MLKLIKLEYRKAQLKQLLFVCFGFIPLLIFWCVYNNGGHSTKYANYQSAFADIHYYVHTIFLTITALLISKIVIDEYRNRTITVLFTYPHSRQSIMVAKLIFVSLFALFSTLLSNVIVAGAFFLHHNHMYTMNMTLLRTEWILILLFAVAAAGISLVSYFVGMIRKSIASTILFPLLITAASSSFYEGKSLGITFCISLGWLLLGISLAYFRIRNIDRLDIE